VLVDEILSSAITRSTWSSKRPDGRVVAFEVKLSQVVVDRDVAQLNWLASKVGDELLGRVVTSTGQSAYRRPDGVALVPAACSAL